jgi:type II secretory pathway pseudopilin PulG
MGDDNVKAVLKRAADDPAFLQALLADREAALKDAKLEPHERQMLISVPKHQLATMVATAQARPWHQSPVVKAGCVVAAAAALLPLLVPSTLGLTREVAEERAAQSLLYEIAAAEEQYKAQHGRYGVLTDVKTLLDWSGETPLPPRAYEYTIIISGDSFTATARHKERPTTRKAFTVGPDGVVKELPRAEGKE